MNNLNPNTIQDRAAHIMKAFGQNINIQKGGVGSGRKLTVNHEKYSWGHLVKVGDGKKNSWHAVMHPEHLEKITKLKEGDKHHFKDEQGVKWTVHKKDEGEGYELHGHGSRSNYRGDFDLPKTVKNHYSKED